ncbi:hypothetical protein SB772_44190, partial [Paraburkholderia sp. SIMBA_030]
LNSLILKDKKLNQIKKIDLIQSYRIGYLDHSKIHPAVLVKDQLSDKRLFLNQVNEVDVLGNIIASYKLDYNPKELPNRHSNS